MWWAEHEFRKLRPLPEGGTLGDAFKMFRQQFRRPHPEDREHVRPPSTLMYLWAWFWEIAQGRPVAGSGALLPLPSTEIAAWASLARVELKDWEVQAIRALDAAFLRVAGEKHT